MSPRPGTRARSWQTPLAVLFLLALCGGRLEAETFEFRDARPVARGKVLVEFEDFLFVVLDGEAARFLSRAELEAVVDESGQRHETPNAGLFAPLLNATPAGAITHVEGEVWLEDAGALGAARGVIGSLPVFVRPGQTVVTGEAGLARAVFPSGAVLKLAASSRTTLNQESAEELVQPLAGEVWLETGLRPLLSEFTTVVARLERGSQLGCQRDEELTSLRQFEGTTELSWPGLSFQLEAGAGIELEHLGSGSWRLTADVANLDPIVLQVAGERVELAPGETYITGGVAQQSGVWRLLSGTGELYLRRGKGRFVPIGSAQRQRTTLSAGDGFQTGASSSATLTRADGAAITLGELASLAVGRPNLQLARGQATVESLDQPVLVDTPGGTATLTQSVVVFLRHRSQEEGQLPTPLWAEGVAGLPGLPLGPSGLLTLEPQTRLVLRRDAEARRVEVEAGRALLASRAPTGQPDPGYRATLHAGEGLGLKVNSPRPTLLLPGERALRFQEGPLAAELSLRPQPRLRFATRASIETKEGLALALAGTEAAPQLRFRSGPRLTLLAPIHAYVENPTLVLRIPELPDTTVEVVGDVAARLEQGGPFAAASLGTRLRDRLELPPGGRVLLDRDLDLTRLAYREGHRLWVQDGAPPVQARFADARGELYLTMPGTAALGLPVGRRFTVMATKDGEFIILDEDRVELSKLDAAGILLLTEEPPGPFDSIARDRIPDLLEVPRPVSPAGP